MFAGWVNRGQQASIEYLKEENRVLRELHGARRLCFNDEQRARLARKAKALPHAVLREIGSLVTPDTMMRWYRRLIAHKYDGTDRRGPGRRPEPQKVRELVVRLATDNPGWGYTRIRDVMWHLGRQISRTTVRRILKADGIEPAPQRRASAPSPA
jgi:transposase